MLFNLRMRRDWSIDTHSDGTEEDFQLGEKISHGTCHVHRGGNDLPASERDTGYGEVSVGNRVVTLPH